MLVTSHGRAFAYSSTCSTAIAPCAAHLLRNASETINDFSLHYIFIQNIINAWAQILIFPLTLISFKINATNDSRMLKPQYKKLKSKKNTFWDVVAECIVQ
jgi:hypothetical protein